jgi:collagen type III alpha
MNIFTGHLEAEIRSRYFFNQKVQANEKGGLADAQANGPGQTSSQAQIGFKPQSEDNDNQKTIFNGGGSASAQSSAHTGQSQSQINGNFK